MPEPREREHQDPFEIGTGDRDRDRIGRCDRDIGELGRRAIDVAIELLERHRPIDRDHGAVPSAGCARETRYSCRTKRHPRLDRRLSPFLDQSAPGQCALIRRQAGAVQRAAASLPPEVPIRMAAIPIGMVSDNAASPASGAPAEREHLHRDPAELACRPRPARCPGRACRADRFRRRRAAAPRSCRWCRRPAAR